MTVRRYLQENRLLILLIKKRNELETNLLYRILSSNLNWQYILEAAKDEGIFYPLYQQLLVLDAKDNFFSQDIRDRFKQLYYAYISQSVVFSDQINRVLGGIEAKGIKILLLKGPSIDAIIYKEDFLRPRLDLDLVVRSEGFSVLEEILISLGYSFNQVEKNYLLPEYLNSRLYFKKNNKGIPLHVHRHIINNLYLMVLGKMPVDMERVWQETAQYKEYNSVFCLKPELQLLYMCEHALKHEYERLIFLYEIERLVNSLRDSINWDKLVLLAQELELSFALYYGLYFIKDILSADVPEGVLTSLRPCKFTIGEKFFIRCTLERKRIKYLSYLVYLSRHKGLCEKTKFVLKTIFPPKFNLRSCLIRLKRIIRQ